jgi:hypothetical protein
MVNKAPHLTAPSVTCAHLAIDGTIVIVPPIEMA